MIAGHRPTLALAGFEVAFGKGRARASDSLFILGFAAVVLAVQAAGALLAFGIALRRSGPPPNRAAAPEPPAMGAELA